MSIQKVGGLAQSGCQACLAQLPWRAQSIFPAFLVIFAVRSVTGTAWIASNLGQQGHQDDGTSGCHLQVMNCHPNGSLPHLHGLPTCLLATQQSCNAACSPGWVADSLHSANQMPRVSNVISIAGEHAARYKKESRIGCGGQVCLWVIGAGIALQPDVSIQTSFQQDRRGRELCEI